MESKSNLRNTVGAKYLMRAKSILTLITVLIYTHTHTRPYLSTKENV